MDSIDSSNKDQRKGGFKPGESGNKGGRPKGAINKSAKFIRDYLADTMIDNLSNLQTDLNKMTPFQRWQILKGLSDKFLPTLTHSDIEANVNGSVKFIVEYVDSTPHLDSTNIPLIEEAEFEQLEEIKLKVPVQKGIEPSKDSIT